MTQRKKTAGKSVGTKRPRIRGVESDALLKDLFGKLRPYFTDRCPFTQKPKANAPVRWVEPRFVCEVAFQEWTSDGKMRAPSFLGLRDNKDPKEVVREH